MNLVFNLCFLTWVQCGSHGETGTSVCMSWASVGKPSQKTEVTEFTITPSGVGFPNCHPWDRESSPPHMWQITLTLMCGCGIKPGSGCHFLVTAPHPLPLLLSPHPLFLGSFKRHLGVGCSSSLPRALDSPRVKALPSCAPGCASIWWYICISAAVCTLLPPLATFPGDLVGQDLGPWGPSCHCSWTLSRAAVPRRLPGLEVGVARCCWLWAWPRYRLECPWRQTLWSSMYKHLERTTSGCTDHTSRALQLHVHHKLWLKLTHLQPESTGRDIGPIPQREKTENMRCHLSSMLGSSLIQSRIFGSKLTLGPSCSHWPA